MTEPNHTRGPWLFVPAYSNGCEVGPTIRAKNERGGTSIIAECHGAPYLGFTETRPNALLISAAPDLLAACRAALAHLTLLGDPFAGPDWELGHRLSAAIGKATDPDYPMNTEDR